MGVCEGFVAGEVCKDDFVLRFCVGNYYGEFVRGAFGGVCVGSVCEIVGKCVMEYMLSLVRAFIGLCDVFCDGLLRGYVEVSDGGLWEVG